MISWQIVNYCEAIAIASYMASQSKKERLSALLKRLRGDRSIEVFIEEALEGGVSYGGYYSWEAAQSYPSSKRWMKLWPNLCAESGLEREEIERYLEGQCELDKLLSMRTVPVAEPEFTRPRFKLWITTLTLPELSELLADLTAQIREAIFKPDKPKTLEEPTPSADDSLWVTSFELMQRLSTRRLQQVVSWGYELLSFRVRSLSALECPTLSGLLVGRDIEALAQRFHLDDERLGRIASGTLRPNDKELVSLAAALNIPSEDLLDICEWEFGSDTHQEKQPNGKG